MKHIIMAPAIVLLAWHGTALAADLSDPLPRLERSGDDFHCHSDKVDADPAAVQPCLRIGPIFVGMSRKRLEERLGEPGQTVTEGGREAMVAYYLDKETSGFVTTYLQVVYAPDRTVQSAQLAGLAWNDNWRFCGLALGNSVAAMRARLGEPLSVTAGANGMETENYSSFFSIQTHNGVISTIRVAAVPQ